MEIHVLHGQGNSIRAIAKQLGVSRNTVRRYLRDLTVVPRESLKKHAINGKMVQPIFEIAA